MPAEDAHPEANAGLEPENVDIDDDDNLEGRYERVYEDEHSWEQLEEDEFGNLRSKTTAIDDRARRRRLLSAAASARIRRGMIRYMELIIDLSRAASLTDMRPVRSAVMFDIVQNFIRTFFNENPLSQLGVIILRNGVAEKLTELSSSPKMHIERLRQNLDTGGAASLQNGLDVAVSSLQRIPPYGHREALILLAALSSCDPGNIFDSIQAAKTAKVRVSVVGLSAEVHVCRVMATETGGKYTVATGDAHLEELMAAHAIPPPAPPGSTGASLVRMGFPAKGSSAAGAATFVGVDCRLVPGAYTCPRCKARVDELPSECHVCSLTLVSSPHLARSYHHLFPVKVFNESERPGAQSCCYGCSRSLEEGLPSTLTITLGGNSRVEVQPARGVPCLQCPECQRVFCSDCDAYIHEHLHSCPGCECIAVEQREK